MANYNRQDRFFKKAKQDKFVARSAYKLEEIDRRFKLFNKGQRIVDLGCAPGSWLQYLAGVVGPKGLVLGYDLELPRVAAGAQVQVVKIDVHELTSEMIRNDARNALGREVIEFDALISDMAPKLTGVRDTDQARSIGLAEKALFLASELLGEGGVFVAKMFQGRDSDQLLASVKQQFDDVRMLRPEATREGSREAFIIAQGRKTPVRSLSLQDEGSDP